MEFRVTGLASKVVVITGGARGMGPPMYGASWPRALKSWRPNLVGRRQGVPC